MSEPITIHINGKQVSVATGTLVAAAIATSGTSGFRRSVLGTLRGPLCGMGICMECRVTINGREHCRICQILCEPGMEIYTDE